MSGRANKGMLKSVPPARTGRRRKVPLIWLAGLLVSALILFGPMLHSPPSFGASESANGYPQLVQRLTDAGLLKLAARADASDAGRVEIDRARLARQLEAAQSGTGPLGECRRRPGLLWRTLERATGRATTPTYDECLNLLQSYARASFLREDMQVDSGAIWRRNEGRLLGLAPGAHMVSDATRSVTQWTGSVDYARPYQSLMLVDTATRKVLFRFDPRQRSTVVLAPSQLAQAGAPELSGTVALLRAGDRQCAGNATLALFGDHALLTLLPTNQSGASDCPDLWFDGEKVQGRDLEANGFRYRVLRPGQTLTVGERNPVVLQLVRSIGAVSALDDGRRRYEPTLAALGAAVAGAGPQRERIVTSIDPLLHFTAQQRLEALGVREMAGERSSFRAGAMLVDGLTGEIVAAPTFPVSVNQLVEGDRNNSNWLNRLGLNTNLERLQVGSTAKVPFATAIVQEYPQLLGLTVTGKPGGFNSVLGERLLPEGKLLEDHVGGTIDFPTFIARSSNYYAVMLMKLAASPTPLVANGAPLAPGDGYAIGGVARSRAPKMPGGDQMWGRDWNEQLWRLLCVAPYRKGEGLLNGWSEQRARSGCPLAYFASDAVARPGLLGAIYHDSLDLELDRVNPRAVYQDYLMSILGQNRSVWSNAALVQAYARIVGDRKLALRFDRRSPLEPGGADPFPRLGLNRAVWSNVTKGMAGAVAFGTAERLGKAVAGFEGLSVYAKTGTPTLARRPGVGEQTEQGHAIVVAFVRYRGGLADPRNICSLRMVVVNIEDRDGGEKGPALDYVIGLVGEKVFADWLAAPCRADGGGARP